MEKEQMFERAKAEEKKEDPEEALRKMRLEAQKDNLESINREIAEKSGTEQISELQKEKTRTEKIKNALENPEILAELRLATLQLKSKREEIEKVNKEMVSLELPIAFYKESLKNGNPSKDAKGVEIAAARIEKLKIDKKELEEEKKFLEEKMAKIEERLSN